jgi:hypothetical protein
VALAAWPIPAWCRPLVAFWDVAVPTTGPSHARARAASTVVLPVPAGPVITSAVILGITAPDRGVQHRDGLGERDRHVDVDGGLPGRPRGLAFQLDQPLGGRVRLGRHQPGQVIGEGRVSAAGPAELGAGARVDLPVHRLIRLTLNQLARGEAEGLGAGSPPAAGRFAGLGGVDVVAAGRARRAGLGLGLPDRTGSPPARVTSQPSGNAAEIGGSPTRPTASSRRRW